ncbi:MAG: N-glycosylase/DNA lyase [Candidatus Woesearchaeota archaeon]
MKSLKNLILQNVNSNIKSKIDKRLNDFKKINKKTKEEWFSELCFCILTANSKASTAINIQNQLGYHGFRNLSQEELSNFIRNNKHRFHNNKSKYICESRNYENIQEIIINIIKNKNEKFAREWIANNIKGLGLKEASHFLRNVGYTNLAILDRHVINLMLEHSLIKEKPKTLSKNTYLELENKLQKLCNQLEMSQAQLDMHLWYLKTGEVLK